MDYDRKLIARPCVEIRLFRTNVTLSDADANESLEPGQLRLNYSGKPYGKTPRGPARSTALVCYMTDLGSFLHLLAVKRFETMAAKIIPNKQLLTVPRKSILLRKFVLYV